MASRLVASESKGLDWSNTQATLNPSLRIQYFRDHWSEGVLPGYIPTIAGACRRYWQAKYLPLKTP